MHNQRNVALVVIVLPAVRWIIALLSLVQTLLCAQRMIPLLTFVAYKVAG